MKNEKIETIKDIIDNLPELNAEVNVKLKIFDLLSKVNFEINLLQKQLTESHTRQNVYSEICEKMLDRIIRREY